MNFKRLLCSLAVIFSVSAPVMANGYYASDELTIFIPPFLNVTQDKNVATVSTENTITGNNLTLGTPIAPKYEIVSNEDITIHVSAAANIEGGEISALHGNGTNSMIIVFTKSDGSTTASSVRNCVSGSATPKENPNAIAFVFHCNEPVNNENNPVKVSVNNNHIEYDISKGTTILSYLISGNSVDGTFSSDDTVGNYKATLTVADVAP